ncbi:MAG TPA: MFS transporter [Burkholderiales bacterium]|nr:MFS transporter [Burkholderiales bacterium]
MTNWPAVWVIFAGGLAAGAYMTKVPPALPTLRADLGLTLVESGWIQTMLYTIGASVGVFFGVFAERAGVKRAALAGLGLMVAGGLLGALAGGYGTLLAARFLEGVGFLLFVVAAAPLLTAATLAQDRATAFSIWSSYMPTGGALALLVAPVALSSIGWRGLWVVLAAYTALCAALLARKVPAAQLGTGIGSLRLLLESLARPGSLALCLGFICYVGQWTSLMTWLPTFVVDERGASPAAAALVTAAFVAINIPGNQLGGLLLRSGMARWAVMAAGAFSMGATALGFFSTALPDAARLACVLAFSTLGGVIPAAVFSGTTVHAKSPQHIGTTNGMVMQSSHAAQFVIPILIAWAASRAGSWSASLQVMLALAVTGIVAALIVGRFERKL